MKFLITILITFGTMAALASAQAPVLPGDDISVDEGAYIIQINNNNDAEIDQSGTHSGEIYQEGITGDGNYARLNQEGNNNTGFISQVGDNNTGVINMTGSDHTSVIVQEGDGHNIQFTVGGSSNIVDIRQIGTSEHTVGFEGDEVSSVTQNGNNNEFYSVQIGEEGGHLITTADGGDYIQDGDGNYISTWQEGDSNTAKFNQYGDNHSIETDQNGSNNSTTISQSSY